jgi:hypothetical protein
VECDRDTLLAKSLDISYEVCPCFSAGICQRALVDEPGVIRMQMGSTVDQKMAAVHGTLCTVPPCNHNQ